MGGGRILNSLPGSRGRMTKISRCQGVEEKEKIAVVWWFVACEWMSSE